MTEKELTALITAHGWSNEGRYCLTDYMYRKGSYTIIMQPGKDFFWYKSGAAEGTYYYQIQCKIQYSDVTLKEDVCYLGNEDFKVLVTKECQLYI